MNEFLLELYSEEIPALFQPKARAQLQTLFEDKLKKHQLEFAAIHCFSTPRRLIVQITGLPIYQPLQFEDIKGPSAAAEPLVIESFLKSNNLTQAQCFEKSLGTKGTFWWAKVEKDPVSTTEILSKIILEIVSEIQWPKSMKWGTELRTWARPLQNIMALFQGKLISLDLQSDYITSRNQIQGHRFLSPHFFQVENFADYQEKLKNNYVMIDPEDRKKSILSQIEVILATQQLTLNQDENLLNEVVGLVEWPVILLGKIEQEFLILPFEVIITTLKNHQRYFSVFDEAGKLAPYFIITSNMETADQGQKIIEGNEKVLRARLSDAMFFWNQDAKRSLTSWNDTLQHQVFHNQLGTIFDKVNRLRGAARLVHKQLPIALLKDLEDALLICKADLSTGLVGEFPELQGIIGSYYAHIQGYNESVCDAVKYQYAPQGPDDFCPNTPLSGLVSLVDKLDTLTGFFGVNVVPTSSKDPYGLRRTALGIIRLIITNKMAVHLKDLLTISYDRYESFDPVKKELVINKIITFVEDRFKTYLKNTFSAEEIQAVWEAAWTGNIYETYEKLKAIQQFLNQTEGKNVFTSYKRVTNILKQFQNLKDSVQYGPVEQSLFQHPAEENLLNKIQEVYDQLDAITLEAIHQNYSKNHRDYSKIFQLLTTLHQPLDEFFKNVMVQHDDKDVQQNRLNLLFKILTLFQTKAQLQ